MTIPGSERKKCRLWPARLTSPVYPCGLLESWTPAGGVAAALAFLRQLPIREPVPEQNSSGLASPPKWQLDLRMKQWI
jgi:hypothetical protein